MNKKQSTSSIDSLEEENRERNLSEFLLPKKRKQGKADLLVRVYRNHLVIDNGKSVVCANANLPRTQKIIKDIRENRLSQELTELLSEKDMLPKRNWVNVKIVEIEDDSKNSRPQYVETVPLERRDADLTRYIHRWISSNCPFASQDEKLEIESKIIKSIRPKDSLFLAPSSSFFQKANLVQYHQQKDNFRRRVKVGIPKPTFPFVGLPFRHVYPTNRVHFVYPHLLYKYIIKNKIHLKPYTKPKSLLPPLPQEVKRPRRGKKKTANNVNSSGGEFFNRSLKGSSRNDNNNSSNASSGGGGLNTNFPVSGYQSQQPTTPYSNYVATPGGACDIQQQQQQQNPETSSCFLRKWMDRYCKVKIATRHLLKPNQEVRLLCFRDLKGRVWTFELRSFLRFRGGRGQSVKPRFHHHQGWHRIVYEARLRRSDEKTKPSLRMVIGRGHECYEQYIKRLKDLFVGRASIVYDQVLDYRTYLKSLAKGRNRRQKNKPPTPTTSTTTTTTSIQQKRHIQQQQQQHRNRPSLPSPHRNIQQQQNHHHRQRQQQQQHRIQRQQQILRRTSTTSSSSSSNCNIIGLLDNNNNIPPSPIRTPNSIDPSYPFGGVAPLSSSSTQQQPPPPPKISSSSSIINNNNNNNNNSGPMMMQVNIRRSNSNNNNKKKKKKKKKKKNKMIISTTGIHQQNNHHHHQRVQQQGQGGYNIIPQPPPQQHISGNVISNSHQIRKTKKIAYPMTESFRYTGSNRRNPLTRGI